MRSLLFFILLISSSKLLSQNAPIAAPVADTSVVLKEITTISWFIDSLKTRLISDTSKFDPKNVIHSLEGIRNINSYSSLFFVNIKYLYKLDIVNGTEVLSFINEILVPERIKSIYVMNIPNSQAIFGRNGMNGVIIIDLKSDSNVNFKIAGLKNNKNRFSNYGPDE